MVRCATQDPKTLSKIHIEHIKCSLSTNHPCLIKLSSTLSLSLHSQINEGCKQTHFTKKNEKINKKIPIMKNQFHVHSTAVTKKTHTATAAE